MRRTVASSTPATSSVVSLGSSRHTSSPSRSRYPPSRNTTCKCGLSLRSDEVRCTTVSAPVFASSLTRAAYSALTVATNRRVSADNCAPSCASLARQASRTSHLAPLAVEPAALIVLLARAATLLDHVALVDEASRHPLELIGHFAVSHGQAGLAARWTRPLAVWDLVRDVDCVELGSRVLALLALVGVGVAALVLRLLRVQLGVGRRQALAGVRLRALRELLLQLVEPRPEFLDDRRLRLREGFPLALVCSTIVARHPTALITPSRACRSRRVSDRYRSGISPRTGGSAYSAASSARGGDHRFGRRTCEVSMPSRIIASTVASSSTRSAPRATVGIRQRP